MVNPVCTLLRFLGGSTAKLQYLASSSSWKHGPICFKQKAFCLFACMLLELDMLCFNFTFKHSQSSNSCNKKVLHPLELLLIMFLLQWKIVRILWWIMTKFKLLSSCCSLRTIRSRFVQVWLHVFMPLLTILVSWLYTTELLHSPCHTGAI